MPESPSAEANGDSADASESQTTSQDVLVKVVIQIKENHDGAAEQAAKDHAEADLACRMAVYERDLLAHQLQAVSEESASLRAQVRSLQQVQQQLTAALLAAQQDIAAHRRQASEAVAAAVAANARANAAAGQQRQTIQLLHTIQKQQEQQQRQLVKSTSPVDSSPTDAYPRSLPPLTLQPPLHTHAPYSTVGAGPHDFSEPQVSNGTASGLGASNYPGQEGDLQSESSMSSDVMAGLFDDPLDEHVTTSIGENGNTLLQPSINKATAHCNTLVALPCAHPASEPVLPSINLNTNTTNASSHLPPSSATAAQSHQLLAAQQAPATTDTLVTQPEPRPFTLLPPVHSIDPQESVRVSCQQDNLTRTTSTGCTTPHDLHPPATPHATPTSIPSPVTHPADSRAATHLNGLEAGGTTLVAMDPPEQHHFLGTMHSSPFALVQYAQNHPSVDIGTSTNSLTAMPQHGSNTHIHSTNTMSYPINNVPSDSVSGNASASNADTGGDALGSDATAAAAEAVSQTKSDVGQPTTSALRLSTSQGGQMEATAAGDEAPQGMDPTVRQQLFQLSSCALHVPLCPERCPLTSPAARTTSNMSNTYLSHPTSPSMGYLSQPRLSPRSSAMSPSHHLTSPGGAVSGRVSLPYPHPTALPLNTSTAPTRRSLTTFPSHQTSRIGSPPSPGVLPTGTSPTATYLQTNPSPSTANRAGPFWTAASSQNTADTFPAPPAAIPAPHHLQAPPTGMPHIRSQPVLTATPILPHIVTTGLDHLPPGPSLSRTRPTKPQPGAEPGMTASTGMGATPAGISPSKTPSSWGRTPPKTPTSRGGVTSSGASAAGVTGPSYADRYGLPHASLVGHGHLHPELSVPASSTSTWVGAGGGGVASEVDTAMGAGLQRTSLGGMSYELGTNRAGEHPNVVTGTQRSTTVGGMSPTSAVATPRSHGYAMAQSPGMGGTALHNGHVTPYRQPVSGIGTARALPGTLSLVAHATTPRRATMGSSAGAPSTGVMHLQHFTSAGGVVQGAFVPGLTQTRLDESLHLLQALEAITRERKSEIEAQLSHVAHSTASEASEDEFRAQVVAGGHRDDWIHDFDRNLDDDEKQLLCYEKSEDVTGSCGHEGAGVDCTSGDDEFSTSNKENIAPTPASVGGRSRGAARQLLRELGSMRRAPGHQASYDVIETPDALTPAPSSALDSSEVLPSQTTSLTPASVPHAASSPQPSTAPFMPAVDMAALEPTVCQTRYTGLITGGHTGTHTETTPTTPAAELTSNPQSLPASALGQGQHAPVGPEQVAGMAKAAGQLPPLTGAAWAQYMHHLAPTPAAGKPLKDDPRCGPDDKPDVQHQLDEPSVASTPIPGPAPTPAASLFEGPNSRGDPAPAPEQPSTPNTADGVDVHAPHLPNPPILSPHMMTSITSQTTPYFPFGCTPAPQPHTTHPSSYNTPVLNVNKPAPPPPPQKHPPHLPNLTAREIAYLTPTLAARAPSFTFNNNDRLDTLADPPLSGAGSPHPFQQGEVSAPHTAAGGTNNTPESAPPRAAPAATPPSRMFDVHLGTPSHPLTDDWSLGPGSEAGSILSASPVASPLVEKAPHHALATHAPTAESKVGGKHNGADAKRAGAGAGARAVLQHRTSPTTPASFASESVATGGQATPSEGQGSVDPGARVPRGDEDVASGVGSGVGGVETQFSSITPESTTRHTATDNDASPSDVDDASHGDAVATSAALSFSTSPAVPHLLFHTPVGDKSGAYEGTPYPHAFLQQMQGMNQMQAGVGQGGGPAPPHVVLYGGEHYPELLPEATAGAPARGGAGGDGGGREETAVERLCGQVAEMRMMLAETLTQVRCMQQKMAMNTDGLSQLQTQYLDVYHRIAQLEQQPHTHDKA